MARVLELLGRPDETNGPPFEISWGQNPNVWHVNAGECVREFAYIGRRGYTSWHIGFDPQNKVISNYRRTSDRQFVVTSP